MRCASASIPLTMLTDGLMVTRLGRRLGRHAKVASDVVAFRRGERVAVAVDPVGFADREITHIVKRYVIDSHRGLLGLNLANR